MDRKPERILTLLLACLLLFLLQCAKEGMPPGGPEDTTPPEVLSASPQTGSTKVPIDSKIEITFSERMLAKETEESVFISPLPKEPFDLRWKGRKLTLLPREPLYPDRTYVISVGADAQDLRRNRLARTYTFAFSTGDRLDFGAISGQVWIRQQVGLKREVGATIWAYLLTPDRSEIDPASEKPDYATQTDTDGGYVLKNLSLGDYRLFAVQDLNRDLIWDWEKEAVGVTTQDVLLNERSVSRTDVDFIVSRQDKQDPSLLNCYAVNRSLVNLEFDEEMEERSASEPGNFEISSVATGKPLRVTCTFFQHGERKRVFLLTEQMDPQGEYEVRVSKLRDRAGNHLDTASNSCQLVGSPLPDTLSPKVTEVNPQDGEANVPCDARITLAFDGPLDHEGLEGSFSLVDAGQIRVTGEGEWTSPNVYVFSPDSPLRGITTYQIRVAGQGVQDEFGNKWRIDSVFTSSFTTVNPDTLGSVSGAVETDEESSSFPAILTLWHLQRDGLFYRLAMSQSGPFRFEAVLPGRYFLGGHLDSDEDGAFSLGQPQPFSLMEPFAVFPDTIYVRPRWETEEVRLRFR